MIYRERINDRTETEGLRRQPILCRVVTKGQPWELRLFGELGEEQSNGRYKACMTLGYANSWKASEAGWGVEHKMKMEIQTGTGSEGYLISHGKQYSKSNGKAPKSFRPERDVNRLKSVPLLWWACIGWVPEFKWSDPVRGSRGPGQGAGSGTGQKRTD